ncbi:hypothetical protein GCM10027444_29530 [Actinopolyspora lacussalsi]
MDRRTDRRTELHEVARQLARYHHRATDPVVDVEAWLADHEHRRILDVLLVVWDRADARLLQYFRPDADVCVAGHLVSWARRRAHDAARPDEIPEQGPVPGQGPGEPCEGA